MISNSLPTLSYIGRCVQNHSNFLDQPEKELMKIILSQIRRMIGALCAVGEGRISERDIYELLTIPSFRTWDELCDRKLIETAPACALYFIGINYKPDEEQSLNDLERTARGTRVRSFFE